MLVGGVDLGGTHVSAGLIDLGEQRAVTDITRRPLDAQASAPRLIEAIADTMRSAGTARDWGIASPSPFDYARGVSWIKGVRKLEALYGVDMRAELANRLRIEQSRLHFLNDAHAFGLGEWWAGAATGHSRVIGVTLGTGLGGVFLEDDRRVASGDEVPAGGWLFPLQIRGQTADELISRRGILRRYGGTSDTDVVDVAERARGGERQAREVFDYVFGALDELLRPWIVRFEPGCVVVGGSIAGSWPLIRDAAGWGGERTAPTFERAANLDTAPLLGAAYHASQ